MRIFGPSSGRGPSRARRRPTARAAARRHPRRGGRSERTCALVLVQAVDEQPLALADAVLLSGNLDDRVGHVSEGRRGPEARESPRMIADYARFEASKSSIHSDIGTYSATPSSPCRLGGLSLAGSRRAVASVRRRLLAFAAAARTAAGALLLRRASLSAAALRPHRPSQRPRRRPAPARRRPLSPRDRAVERGCAGRRNARCPPHPRLRHHPRPQSPSSCGRVRRACRDACASSSAARPHPARRRPQRPPP
jgi:hypothetical protein